MKTKNEERFDNIVGTILFLLMMGTPLLMLIFGWGGGDTLALGKYWSSFKQHQQADQHVYNDQLHLAVALIYAGDVMWTYQCCEYTCPVGVCPSVVF